MSPYICKIEWSEIHWYRKVEKHFDVFRSPNFDWCSLMDRGQTVCFGKCFQGDLNITTIASMWARCHNWGDRWRELLLIALSIAVRSIQWWPRSCRRPLVLQSLLSFYLVVQFDSWSCIFTWTQTISLPDDMVRSWWWILCLHSGLWAFRVSVNVRPESGRCWPLFVAVDVKTFQLPQSSGGPIVFILEWRDGPVFYRQLGTANME